MKKQFNHIFNYLFNRWSKWEIHEENLPYLKPVFNFAPELGGQKIGDSPVLVDTYVKTNNFTGLKKYKKVVKR